MYPLFFDCALLIGDCHSTTASSAHDVVHVASAHTRPIRGAPLLPTSMLYSLKCWGHPPQGHDKSTHDVVYVVGGALQVRPEADDLPLLVRGHLKVEAHVEIVLSRHLWCNGKGVGCFFGLW